jgi:hypothetical protein
MTHGKLAGLKTQGRAVQIPVPIVQAMSLASQPSSVN